MKRIFYSAILIASVIMVSCKHKQAVTTSATASSSQQTSTSTQPAQGGGSVTTTVSNSVDSTVTTTVTAPETGTSTTVAAVDSANIYRVTISFISRGEGIDYKTLESIESWIKNQPKSPAIVKTHWGREGETNLCLKLNELSTREQEIFVRDLRNKLTDNKLVLVAEYAECKGKAE